MNILIFSTSLNPNSRSRVMARRAEEHLLGTDADVSLVDLQDIKMPFCGSPDAWGNQEVSQIAQQISAADGILVATPVYNYDVNAACKNLIELTGKAWEDKVVGFCCAAGGDSSYMSIMALANSLMLDFRCVIAPRFVYATGLAFDDGKISDKDVDQRVVGLADTLAHMAGALKK